jgi:hypothetical protein
MQNQGERISASPVRSGFVQFSDLVLMDVATFLAVGSGVILSIFMMPPRLAEVPSPRIEFGQVVIRRAILLEPIASFLIGQFPAEPLFGKLVRYLPASLCPALSPAWP